MVGHVRVHKNVRVAGNNCLQLCSCRLKAAVKSVGSQLLLVFTLVAYTAAGAKIFQYVELPQEKAEVWRVCGDLSQQRSVLLSSVIDLTAVKIDEAISYRRLLDRYEQAVISAAQHDCRHFSPSANYTFKWTYSHSLFFASTVLTTIGYGDMAPKTVSGRVFCMIFALIGIPLTVTVVSNTGATLAGACSAVFGRLCTALRSSATTTTPRAEDYTPSTRLHNRALYVFLSLSLLVLYIALGGLLFLLWEQWSFLESFYFCFITMTTIGFGDLVPANASYLLVCTVYVFVGLSLTTTIIELVRRQYAKSWKQVKLLSSRLQGLSGPLAEHLRKLAEQGGALQLDNELLDELKQLRVFMNSTNIRHNFNMADSELDALNAHRAVIQIVFYESNV